MICPFFLNKELEKLLPPSEEKISYNEEDVEKVHLMGEEHIHKEDPSSRREAYEEDRDDDDDHPGAGQGMQCATH